MFSNLPVRLAAALGALLLLAGAAALWFASSNSRAVATVAPPPLPDMASAQPADLLEPVSLEARKKSREEQRFARADKNDDGRILQAEYLQARRRNFDKLDLDSDGRLSFDEYASSGIARFRTADADADGALDPIEFATTAPKPKNRQMASAERCRCPQDEMVASSSGQSQD